MLPPPPSTTAVTKRQESMVGSATFCFALYPENSPASMSAMIHGPGPLPLPQAVAVPKYVVSMVPVPTARPFVEELP